MEPNEEVWIGGLLFLEGAGPLALEIEEGLLLSEQPETGEFEQFEVESDIESNWEEIE